MDLLNVVYIFSKTHTKLFLQDEGLI